MDVIVNNYRTDVRCKINKITEVCCHQFADKMIWYEFDKLGVHMLVSRNSWWKCFINFLGYAQVTLSLWEGSGSGIPPGASHFFQNFTVFHSVGFSRFRRKCFCSVKRFRKVPGPRSPPAYFEYFQLIPRPHTHPKNHSSTISLAPP